MREKLGQAPNGSKGKQSEKISRGDLRNELQQEKGKGSEGLLTRSTLNIAFPSFQGSSSKLPAHREPLAPHGRTHPTCPCSCSRHHLSHSAGMTGTQVSRPHTKAYPHGGTPRRRGRMVPTPQRAQDSTNSIPTLQRREQARHTLAQQTVQARQT